jgi:PKD repeat protein
VYRNLFINRIFGLLGLALLAACGIALVNIDPLTPKGKVPKRDRMDMAWQHEFDITRDPNTMTVPRERLMAAYEYTRTLQQSANRMAGALTDITWTERGPMNVSGRTRSLVISSLDPSGQTVFAAGVGGGIWKTTNISSSTPDWVPVNDFFANIAITTIAQDPSDGQIIYFGTGEGWSNADAIRGDGIWKSTDGGTTFTQMAGTANNSSYHYVNKVVVHPTTGDLYAATNSGLFRFVQATSTWSKVLGNGSGSAINSMADVEIAADGAIIASTGAGFAGADGVYRSTSGNLSSFTKLNSGTNGFPTSGFYRIELACAPSNAAVIYALVHSSASDGLLNIYKSTDTGANWTTCTKPSDADPGIANDITRGQAWYDLSIAVDPGNSNTLIVGGIDLFKSTTGGNNWQQLTHWYGGFGFQNVHADQHAVVYRNSSEIYFTNDGGIYRSINGGTTITFAGTNFNVTQYYACAIHPALGSNKHLAGSQDNGSQQYSTPGINNTVEVTGGDGAYCHIDQQNESLQFTSYVYNNYYRSTDGGGTFTSIRSNNNGSFINPTDFDDSNKVFYGCYRAGEYTRLLNAGSNTTWDNIAISAFNAERVSAISCSPITPYRVFFGLRNGRVVRVDNAHTASPTGVLLNGSGTGFPIFGSTTISCIAIENDDDNHLLVTVSNYGVTSVWETKNGGANWLAVEGNIPDMPVRFALFNPLDSSSAMIATELGVWTTDNLNGASTVWGPSNTGLANVRTNMLQIRGSDNIVIAATHGRGLYSTDYFSPAYAEFVADHMVAYTNKPIQFTDGSVKANSWSWNFGDATSSTLKNPVKSYANPGVYTVTLQINGNAGLVKTRTSYITVLPNRGTPYTPSNGGSFDTNANDFAGEYIGGTKWQRGSSAVANKNGTRSGSFAWVTNLTGNYSDNTQAVLYTPNFYCMAPGTYTLKFYRKNKFEIGYDGYRVEYSLNKGDTWNILGTNGGSWYDYANPGTTSFPAGEPYFNSDNLTNFVLAQLDVSFLAGNANVAFRFVFRSDELFVEAGVAIDDFELIGPNNTQLPVSLGSFTGRRKVADNFLSWNTFSEVDNKGFYLERSFDGFKFEPITFINGAGTTSVLQEYNYTDRNILSGKTYYRLLQVDFDGDYAYSRTIALSGNAPSDAWVRLFPVPVHSTLNLLFTDVPEEEVVVTIYDASGALKYRDKLAVSGAGISIPVEDKNMSQGAYVLSIEADGKRFSERFIKY